MTTYKFIPRVFCGWDRSLVCHIGRGIAHTVPDQRSPSDFPGLKTIYEVKK